MITFRVKGDFNKTNTWLRRALKLDLESILHKYGKMGVKALKDATPKDTGKTAASWDYYITTGEQYATIKWTNSNINHYTSENTKNPSGKPISHYANVALILQYGHATKNGGWVQGIDYINPALKPVFENFSKEAWEEVTQTRERTN